MDIKTYKFVSLVTITIPAALLGSSILSIVGLFCVLFLLFGGRYASKYVLISAITFIYATGILLLTKEYFFFAALLPVVLAGVVEHRKGLAVTKRVVIEVKDIEVGCSNFPSGESSTYREVSA